MIAAQLQIWETNNWIILRWRTIGMQIPSADNADKYLLWAGTVQTQEVGSKESM